MKKYVNAYAVTREYGGPEEGGWWYDTGDVLASELCDGKHAEVVRARLEEEFCQSYAVPRGARLSVHVEDVPAAPWPAEKPYYS